MIGKSIALQTLVVGVAYSFSPVPGGKIASSTFQLANKVPTVPNTNTALRMSALSDAQELLRKARALREQAEADEADLHATLISKKQQQDEDTDRTIEKLFPLNLDKANDPEGCNQKIASIIEKERFSVGQLEKVVERLHEREIAAKGLDHVEPSLHHTHVKFERVSAKVDQDELKRVEGMIDMLIDAASILDENTLKAEEKALAEGKKHHVDASHWASGRLSSTLAEKAHFLGREYDEQFQNRLEEYYAAARKKENVKDKGDRTSMFP